MFVVEWTGDYPNLCHGDWVIRFNGQLFILPENVRSSNMFTYGKFDTWEFSENWAESWTTYENGLECAEWIEKNIDWIDANFDRLEIPKGFFIYHLLYKEINKVDWRTNSCGGCI